MTKLNASLLAIYNEILEISLTQFLFCNAWVCKNVLIAMQGTKAVVLMVWCFKRTHWQTPILTTAAIHLIQSLKQNPE